LLVPSGRGNARRASTGARSIYGNDTMSGSTQQKKKHGDSAKRKGTAASSTGRQGKSAGSAAAGHSVGERARSTAKTGTRVSTRASVAETGGGDGRAATPGRKKSGFD
jgi:hypothetical protein